MKINISAPTTALFVISLIVAGIAVLAALGSFGVMPMTAVWLMAIAYAVLAAACLIKRA